MAVDEKKEEAKKEEAQPKSKKTLLIAIIAVVVIGIGAGAFLFMKGKSGAKHGGEEAAATEEGGRGEEAGGHGEASAQGKGTVYNLDPFIVNLQDNSGTRYLKLTINLELAPGSGKEEINTQTSQIRDSLIILLSSKSYADIGTVEGKYQMRDEIVARVNQFLTKTKVKTAYFTDFVIQ